MPNIIDNLSIEFEGKSKSAIDSIADVSAQLSSLANAVEKLNGLKIKSFVTPSAIKQIHELSFAFNSLDISRAEAFAGAMREIMSLGGGKLSISGFSEKNIVGMYNFADAVRELDIPKLRELASVDFSNMNVLASASRTLSSLASQLHRLEDVTKRADKAQKNLNTTLRSTKKDAKGAGHSFNFAHTAVGKFLNSIKRIMFYRAIRTALRTITQGFAEGIENLYYWSQAWNTSFAPRMDQLATAQLYLKNGFASMFSPLIERAIPIIDQVIDKVVDMFNIVQQTFAVLTGAPTWNKAIKYPVQYAENLDNAGKKAKALQNILMDFDEINAINTPNDSSGGSGSDAKDYSSMFKLMKIATEGESPFGWLTPILKDVYGKVEELVGIGKRFGLFLKGLDFEPLKASLKSFWEGTLSPIIDDMTADLDWFREKVLQPITQFLVEKGLPGALDTLSVAIKNLWDSTKPLRDGLKKFWDENGDWILQLLGSQTLLAFDKIKEAFKEIGDWFKENKSIKKIFDSISSMAKKLSPIILAISDLVASDGWQTFVDGVQTILDALDPILESLAGVLELLDGIINLDPDKMASGLESILRSIVKCMVNPLATVMDFVGKVFDGLAKVAGWFGWKDLEKEFKETANLSRENADEIRRWGEDFTVLKSHADSAHKGIVEGHKGVGQSFAQLGSKGDETYKILIESGNFAAAETYRAWAQSLDNTQSKTSSTAKEAGKSYSAIGATARGAYEILGASAQQAAAVANKAATETKAHYDRTFSFNQARTLGNTFGVEFARSLKAAVDAVHINKEITVTERKYQVYIQKQANLAYEDSRILARPFASGGFPAPASLFWAGENGVPELMGTVGGRTAVAGGAEITGIREAIIEQGQREEGLLRQMISAIQNKDISLVANSATGRWVNKALKAYSGVTG